MPIHCPRCVRGQMFIEKDTGITTCLQCGYTNDPRKGGRIPISEYGRGGNSLEQSWPRKFYTGIHSNVRDQSLLDVNLQGGA